MKKLMFTAIALVAFSGVSMANTIAEEVIIKENNNIKKENIIKENYLCQDAFENTMSACVEAGLDVDSVWAIGEAVYRLCLFTHRGI